MQINVLSDDMRLGNASKDICPITVALRRQFGNGVSISRDYIRYRKKRSGKTILVPLPKKAQNYLLDGIGAITYTPFSFRLSKEAVKKLKG